MTFGELKETQLYRMANFVKVVNRNGEEYNLHEVPYNDLLNAYVAGQHLSNGHLTVMVGLEYSLVFKVKNNKNIYISGFDGSGNLLHTEDESKAFKFFNLKEAMRYYDCGYGIITKVPKTS